MPPTLRARELRAVLDDHRTAIEAVLRRYGASNPRLFGSVARGDAGASSDLDLLVDLAPGGRNPLMRLAGISEELTDLLGVRVDVVAESLLRHSVSATARSDMIAL